jgi:nucleotide-binding universal stress UspA family protein
MFNRIIAATDGSEAASRALMVAADLARNHHAKLTLVHVIENSVLQPAGLTGAAVPSMTPLGFGMAPTPEMAIYRQEVRKKAERMLDAALASARQSGVSEVDSIIEEGNPADCIVETAQREHADTIVMGSRGYSDFKGLLAGSVSHKVADSAKCTCIAVT